MLRVWSYNVPHWLIHDFISHLTHWLIHAPIFVLTRRQCCAIIPLIIVFIYVLYVIYDIARLQCGIRYQSLYIDGMLLHVHHPYILDYKKGGSDMASIKDIAQSVGVSISTVSRVLNNPEYKCQTPELRDKIWNAAMKLNYTPNQSARQLKNGKGASVEKTYYINVLMTRMDSATSDPFFTELLHVIESEIHKNGCILSKVWYRSIFSDDRRCRYENVDSVIRRMCEEADGHTDGLIVIGKCNRAALKKLSQCYRSTVYVNRDSANGEVDEVICNGSQIARTAVEYLISLGHENIGYVGSCNNEARYRGYLEALHDHGLDIDADYVINTKLSEVEGFEAMEHFMKSDKSPTGIYCANDITAIGMLKYLAKCKNRYYTPSIISSDGIEEAQYTTPMLTTVEISKTDMGHFALQLLMDRLKGGHKGVARIELQCKLIKRDSCTLAEDSKWCEYYI